MQKVYARCSAGKAMKVIQDLASVTSSQHFADVNTFEDFTGVHTRVFEEKYEFCKQLTLGAGKATLVT